MERRNVYEILGDKLQWEEQFVTRRLKNEDTTK
jgi:hypothetical protein